MRRIAPFLALLLAGCATAGPRLDPPADLVFWGGPIYTARDAQPRVDAVAVDDGRIVYAGGRAGGLRQHLPVDLEQVCSLVGGGAQSRLGR